MEVSPSRSQALNQGFSPSAKASNTIQRPVSKTRRCPNPQGHSPHFPKRGMVAARNISPRCSKKDLLCYRCRFPWVLQRRDCDRNIRLCYRFCVPLGAPHPPSIATINTTAIPIIRMGCFKRLRFIIFLFLKIKAR